MIFCWYLRITYCGVCSVVRCVFGCPVVTAQAGPCCLGGLWLLPVLRRPSFRVVSSMPSQRETRLPLSCHALQGSLLLEPSTAVGQSPCTGSVPRGVSLLLVCQSVCPLPSRLSSAGAPRPNCSWPFPPLYGPP